MKVLIIEDELPGARRLVSLIQQLEPSWSILTILDEVNSAVEWLATNPAPDLIFMDIQLADGFSFEIFERHQVVSPVVFVTAFDQYAINAFRVNGLDYLLKPIQLDLLQASIDRFKATHVKNVVHINQLSDLFKQRTERFKERFLIKSGEDLSFVRTSEIAYFLSTASYSFIVTISGGRYLVDLTMDEIEKELDPAKFFRINRGQIVGLDCITRITNFFNNRLKLELNPVEKEDTIVSRSRVKPFKEWLNQ
ncbi:MAG: response regulator transcription factor [Crocinitomix sp.]|nr:response regulator transcription factor [Crocinitomix sp.]